MDVRRNFKILMLTEYYAPFDRGGSEWSVHYLAKSLIKKGFQIEIFTPNYGDKQVDANEGVSIYRFPFFKKLRNKHDGISPFYHSNVVWFVSTALFLIYRIFIYKPTHIHVHGKYFIPSAFVVSKVFRVSLIVTLRDYIALCPLAYCIRDTRKYKKCTLSQVMNLDRREFLEHSSAKSNIFFRAFITIAVIRGWLISKLIFSCLRRCTSIITISEKMAKIYVANGIKISEVIYNTQHLSIKNSARNGNYFLFVGRLTFGKGIDVLVEAYTQINQRAFPKLKIIGNGPLLSTLQQFKSSSIEILGQLLHSKALTIIERAKVVVMPSFWEEPFGRVALEAQLAGVPVLASNRGALPEIITHNKTGIIVKPIISEMKNGLLLILKKEKYFRQQLKKNNLFLREKFEIKPVNQYIKVYEKSYKSRHLSSYR